MSELGHVAGEEAYLKSFPARTAIAFVRARSGERMGQAAPPCVLQAAATSCAPVKIKPEKSKDCFAPRSIVFFLGVLAK